MNVVHVIRSFNVKIPRHCAIPVVKTTTVSTTPLPVKKKRRGVLIIYYVISLIYPGLKTQRQ